MSNDYAVHYAKALASTHPDILSFLKLMHRGQGHDFDTGISSILADWFDDHGHPLAPFLRQQPERIYEHDFNNRRGGPGGKFAYFHSLGAEHGFLNGVTRPGIHNNFAGLTLHAIPLNPDYKGKAEPKLTRQSLWTRVWPYSFNRTFGRTAINEFVNSLPEGNLKTNLGLHLKANAQSLFGEMVPEWRNTYLIKPNPVSDAEFQSNIHLDTYDDTHADRYSNWLRDQGDPVADLIHSHIRNTRGGQPDRFNQRSSHYGNYDYIDHRGGRIGIGPPRMYKDKPHVAVSYDVPNPSPEEYPRSPTGNHLVPAWLSWSKYMPVEDAMQFADRLPESERTQMHEALRRQPRPEEE